MEFSLQILLTFITCFSCVKSQTTSQIPAIVQIPYHPEPAPVFGQITATTVTIKQPNCTQLQKSTFCNTNPCYVWVVIAVNPEGLNDYDANKNLANMPTFTHYETFPKYRLFYMTLQTAQSLIICNPTYELALMRVGSDNSCVNAADKPNCNGPIKHSGLLSAKYVLTDPARSNQIVAETHWYNFTLLNATAWQQIDTNPPGRSAGMIVLTVILCVLLFILLLLLIALLIYACTHSMKTQEKFNIPSPQGSIKVARYHTHNMNQPKMPIQ
ncbi:uroplakin-3b-like [Protopterus annectens]|uniref:uroplakin-3b-like n=1 Tax=Protopterus annectens TaxID=7888 RepID=UPI001CFB2AC1|nr:uroplakin-3b-like [Protopterus annectens]